MAEKADGCTSIGITDSLPRPYKINGRFEIPWPGEKRPSVFHLLKFLFFDEDKSNVPSPEVLDVTLPVKPLNSGVVAQPPAEGLTVTWIGHATVLVQMDHITVLTDPMFSENSGPWRMPLGYTQRFRPPSCTVAELPHVDAVVISHCHFDHLDYQSVLQLNQRFGPQLRWFVPEGLRPWMQSCGCETVVELSWWDEHVFTKEGLDAGVKFACVPAQHWSVRNGWDENQTLWGGWCVIGPRHSFYFAGDTAYNDTLFKLIGNQYGPIDLAVLPIGAYSPRWFMQCEHVDPDEAWKVHDDVGAFNSIGIHWGTFKFSHEFYLEPRDRIQKLQDDAAKQEGRLGFFTTKHGQSVRLNGWRDTKVVHESDEQCAPVIHNDVKLA